MVARSEHKVWCHIGQEVAQVLVRFLYNSRIGVILEGPHVGQLVMPTPSKRRIGTLKLFDEKVIYSRYRDIYWLYRAIIHGGDGYRRDRHGEFPRLQNALASARALHAELLSIRKGAELAEKEEALRELIDSVLLYVTPRVRDAGKGKALTQTLEIAKLKDSRGRRNPTPLAARGVTLIDRLRKREETIAGANAIFALRKSILAHTISALDFEVNTSVDYFTKLKDRWGDIVRSDQLLWSVKTRLKNTASLFQSIDIAPYRTTFLYAGDECAEALADLESENFNEGYSVINRSLVGFLLRQLRSNLEFVMLNLSRSVHFKDVPLDYSKTILQITDAQTRLSKLDTKILSDFNADVVQTYLEATNGYLRSRRIVDAHRAFQQALVLL